MSPKITPDHLGRAAVVYVRQSTMAQVTGNLESYTTTVEHVEEIGPGRSKTTSVRQIISYGMALSLPAQYEWLRRVSPGAVWISS